jgi:hypothetical protein
MTSEEYFDRSVRHLLFQAGRSECRVSDPTGTHSVPRFREPDLDRASPLGHIGTDHSLLAEDADLSSVTAEGDSWVVHGATDMVSTDTPSGALVALVRSTGLPASDRNLVLIRALEGVHASRPTDWLWLLAALAVHLWDDPPNDGPFRAPRMLWGSTGQQAALPRACVGCGEGPAPMRVEGDTPLCSYRCYGRYWLRDVV